MLYKRGIYLRPIKSRLHLDYVHTVSFSLAFYIVLTVLKGLENK